MMKRLLLCAVSALFAFSANAIQKDDYVYTPQGRFLITGTENLMGNAGSFANLDGWTVVTAGENTVLADNFTVGLDTASQVRYAQSVRNTVDEGMKYTTSSLDASNTYVISYKLRNAVEIAPTTPLFTLLAKTGGRTNGANVISITGTDSESNVVTYNVGTETTTDWVTYCCAVVGDGTGRTLTINLNSMETSLQIADIQILEAKQVADDRDAQEKAKYIMSIWKLTDWSKYDDELTEIYPAEDLVMAYGQVADITEDMHDYLAGYLTEDEIKNYCPGFNDDLKAYTSQLSTYNEKLSSFMQTQMTAYIDVTKNSPASTNTSYEHLGFNEGNKVQSQGVLGGWTIVKVPAGNRGFAEKNNWAHVGHFAWGSNGSNIWETAEMSREFELFEGGYIFTAELSASVMLSKTDNWTANTSMVSGDGFVYVTNEAGEIIATTDTVPLPPSAVNDQNSKNWAKRIIGFNIPKDGKYTIHMKGINRYSAFNYGGSMLFRYPELYGKAFGEYTAEEKMYISAVQEQITAGDNAYQTALDNLASEVKPWGKTPLQECVDTMKQKKAYWDAMYNQEATIVESYNPDIYVPGATNPASLMVYEVYSSYVQGSLAANRTFNAVNDTLNMLGNKIIAAEDVTSLSVYQASTGMAALQSEIATAKQLDATLRNGDYSEENAKAIKDEIAKLEDAITECKKGVVPAKSYVDIDFEYTSELYDNLVGYTDEMAPATITGKVGALDVLNFKKENVVTDEKGVSSEFPYQLGIDISAERKYAGYLRAGASDATAKFDAKDLGNNILLVSMDWWWSKLGALYSGFEILDEEDNRIAGFVVCTNDNAATVNTFNIDPVSQFYSAINKNDADVLVDAYHSQWTAVLDFANAKQYLIGTLPSGTVISEPVDMVVTGTPATFKLAGSVGKNKYPGRRNWFDNLKIQKLNAVPTAINDAQAASVVAAKPAKRIVKGQLVIEKNGKFFDAVGKRIK